MDLSHTTGDPPTVLPASGSPKTFKEIVTLAKVLPSFYEGDEMLDVFLEADLPSLIQQAATAHSSMPCMKVDLEEYQRLWRPWQKALIIKALGQNIAHKLLMQRISELWKLDWECESIDLEGKYYIVCFHSNKDYDHVLNNGACIVLGYYNTVAKWKPNFHPSKDKVTSTLVWVRFPEIPIEFFHESFMMNMGNFVGWAVKVDATTLSMTWGKFARVSVEIDFKKPLVPLVSVLGHAQIMEYEGLHSIGFSCGEYGHRESGCSKIVKEVPPSE